MPTGYFSGYTGDTLVHLANGERKYMHDLAAGDEVQVHGSNTGAVVTNIIQYEYDGFIALVAPGIATTRYTLYHDLNAGSDTTPIITGCRTIYYRGTIYNFICRNTPPTSVFVMGTNPAVSQIGTYDINKPPYGDELLRSIKEDPANSSRAFNNLAWVWSDPPGQVNQRHPKTATV